MYHFLEFIKKKKKLYHSSNPLPLEDGTNNAALKTSKVKVYIYIYIYTHIDIYIDIDRYI